MKDDNGLTVPGTEGDTWEDNPYEDEMPDRYRRCLLCQLEVPEQEWDTHWADCEIQPWEWV